MIKRINSFLVFSLLCIAIKAQPGNGSFISVINDSSVVRLNKHWNYHKGDKPEWARYDFDDSNWDILSPSLNLDSVPPNTFEGICWFRLLFRADSTLHKPLALIISQSGASEVYIDGQLIGKLGRVGHDAKEEIPFSPREMPLGFSLDKKDYHIIAIRYSNQKFRENYKKYNETMAGIHVRVMDLGKAIHYKTNNSKAIGFSLALLIGLLLALSFVHLLLFFFYKKEISNLYYSLFVFLFSAFFFALFMMDSQNPALKLPLFRYFLIILPLLFYMFIVFLYSLFYNPFPKLFYLITALTIIAVLFIIIDQDIIKTTLIVDIAIVVAETVRVIIKAIIKKHKGARILGVGVLSFSGFVALIIIIDISLNGASFSFQGMFGAILAFILFLAMLSIPISMSVYLAHHSATIHRDLEEQKEKLELRVKERTAEVVQQRELLSEKNKEIIDSITYARRIQSAILPPARVVKEYLQESFILYKPKDIVAGDFYWLEHVRRDSSFEGGKGDVVLFAAADCTGHGVPGAMVSLVCHNALNSALREHHLIEPGKILDKTREIVAHEFEKSDEDVKDGMDIALCSLSLNDTDDGNSGRVLQYAGANNPLWIITSSPEGSNNEEITPLMASQGNRYLFEIKADKQPIGKYAEAKSFTTQTVQLHKGDNIYIFSDGYADQFGGDKGKKFKARAFKDFLLSIQDQSMEQQRKLIDEKFENWKGNLEQLDDVCVIGVRFP